MVSNTNRGLGRGFDSLLPTGIIDPQFDRTKSTPAGDVVQALDVNNILPNPHQPREAFEPGAMRQLANSISMHGVLQPIIVTQKSANQYELIAGERRLRASKIANLTTIPAIVRSLDDQAKLEIALIENLQRADLNPLEMATAYRKLLDQFNVTVRELANRIGRDHATIVNSMRLLGLPPEVKRSLVDGIISEGHARTILTLTDPIKQALLLHTIVSRHLNVRQAEEFARGLREQTDSIKKAQARISKTNALTDELSGYLGAKVTMIPRAKGGRITIEYFSEDELQRIYAYFKDASPDTSKLN